MPDGILCAELVTFSLRLLVGCHDTQCYQQLGQESRGHLFEFKGINVH